MRDVLLLIVATTLPAFAHHSIMATYDPAQPVTIKGVVASFLFRNPHSFVLIDEKKEDGRTVRWSVELAPAGLLGSQGWTRETLPPGAPVSFTGFRGKEKSQQAVSAQITLPDGRVFSTWPGPGTLWPQPTLEEFKAKAH